MAYGGIEPPENDLDVLDALISKIQDGKNYMVDNLANHLNWKMTIDKHRHYRQLLIDTDCFTHHPYSNISPNPVFTFKPGFYNKILKAGSYSKYLDSLPKTDDQLKFIILSKLNDKKNGEGFWINELAIHLNIDINTITTLCQQMAAVNECDSKGGFVIILPAGIHAIRKGFYETNSNPLFHFKVEKMVHNETHGPNSPIASEGSTLNQNINPTPPDDNWIVKMFKKYYKKWWAWVILICVTASAYFVQQYIQSRTTTKTPIENTK